VGGLGSERHRALIDAVVEFYARDDRVRSVVVFGSVAAGTWHELSDVDLDVVLEDDAVVDPADEARSLFGSRAVVVLSSADAADVVLDSLEEVSIRWHALSETSPNIAASLRVVGGGLSDDAVRAAAEANRVPPEQERLLDEFVRYAIGGWKEIRRGNPWDAVVRVAEMRHCLTLLRGRRDALQLDPARPEDALAKTLSEARASFELGPVREKLLDRTDIHSEPSERDSAFPGSGPLG
jgi:predicted nucleotidyltransferase